MKAAVVRAQRDDLLGRRGGRRLALGQLDNANRARLRQFARRGREYRPRRHAQLAGPRHIF
jgi:hypothetical protein